MFKLAGEMPHYVGETKDGCYHGKGCLTDELGKYDGEWVDGWRSGKGVQIFKDGAIYDGEWNKNCFFGEGVLTEVSKIVFSGTFMGDKFVSGTVTLPSGKSSDVVDGSVLDPDVFAQIPKNEAEALNLK